MSEDATQPAASKRHPRLEQFATVVTAASAAGLLAAALGFSGAKIASVSVLVIVLTYLWLYRRQVDSAIATSWVFLAAGLLALGGVLGSDRIASALVGRTLARSTGIVEFVPVANDFLPRLPALIGAAREDVWFAGVSFYITLPANREAMLAALERGVDLRFLVYDPTSPNIDEVAAGFSQTSAELRAESEITLQHLDGLLKEARARGVAGHVEVRFFRSVPKMRLYVMDRHREDGHTFFIPHVDQQNTPNSPGMLARNLRTGITSSFIEGLDRVWKGAASWDEVMARVDTSGSQVSSQSVP